MPFQVSPGVNVTEIDLTTIVPAQSTTDGGFASVFRWGPLEDVTLITNELELADQFGRPDDETFTSFFTAANFLAYGDKLRLVRVANTSSEDFNLTVSTDGSNNLSGSGFEATLRKGSVIDFNSGAEQATVIEVVDDNNAILDGDFTTGAGAGGALDNELVTATTYVGALNATSEKSTGDGGAGVGLLVKNDEDYDANFSGGLADDGLWCAKHPGELGNSLEVSMCPSANAFKQLIADGTTSSVATTGTALTGTATSFLSDLEVGSLVKNPDTGEERTITAIASDTAATLDAAFTSDLLASALEAKWKYADAIGIAPGTSSFAAGKLAADDELHIVVVDKDGRFTGNPGQVLERHSFLSKASDARSDDGAATYYKEAINRNSAYIRWLDHLPAGLNWGQPASSGLVYTAVDKPDSVELAGGRDANTGAAITGARIQGYDLFKNADEIDVALVLLGEANTEVCVHVISNVCEQRKDCIALISPEQGDVVSNAGGEVEDIIEFRNTLPSSSYAVMDCGWKRQYDKYNDTNRWIPLNGDIAGLMVRTDTLFDPWFSPGGFNRGQILNITSLAFNPTKAERDDLYLSGINPVVKFDGEGTILYGDKTLLSKPSAFDRINVRRLFIVLEKSIARSARFSLFEFNDEFTRNNFKNLVEPFLRDVQGRRGIFDFRVVCDSTNNTPEVIDRNEFVGDIYIKPARSINFIQLNFIAVRTGVEFTEIVGQF